MRYLVLATDYDGTLAKNGHVEEPVWAALRRLKQSGRRAVLVTGRELEDLQAICPHLDLFDRVVAENGALIYRPATKETSFLADPPPPEFARALKALNVVPLSTGHVIVATVKPYETAVLKTINEMGLELQVIFNQDAVMVLPSGVNKATGLVAALKEMGYSPHNAVGIGDAENDHALLSACECGAAVGNGVPALRERADLVTRGAEGTSVIDLIDRLLADDLAPVADRMTRHDILLGTTRDGQQQRIAPYGKTVLIAGTSGSGKSTLAAGLLERLEAAKYQYAVIDPEGDYSKVAGTVVLGSSERAPLVEEVLNVLDSGRNPVVNLLGVSVADRPGVFQQLLPTLLEHRSRKGRPHWVVIDEAHHLMRPGWTPASNHLPRRMHGLMLVTVHPASVA
ncbi:MAG: HAD-IIB family hydrolase, partial [Zavarzinella sp.]|nr:HAD-IIB family hydrolase [Zavarzinella sp.]